MPQWTEFLSCPVCCRVFSRNLLHPVSLSCGHTICKVCLSKLHQKKCPFDQSSITRDFDEFPVNNALFQLVGHTVQDKEDLLNSLGDNLIYYKSSKQCIEEIAMYLQPVASAVQSLCHTDTGGGNSITNNALNNSILSRPMQRKLVTLICCQLIEEEGRTRAMRGARSLGERTVTELILQHQNPQQLSANLWAAVRARGCQFLGPAMQEEVLKFILLSLEDGSALSRKVLVLFVVQRLEAHYPQASKTAIGHVVQLLYRASCFMVTKRDEESSLMQLKEEFRNYDSLRREHDSQIVQIAMEAGLRIAPDQWSSLLYGDTGHKSHMQSIIDKLQTPQSFSQSVSELVIALQRTGDPCNLQRLRPHLEFLANVDPSPDAPTPSWENLEAVLKAVKTVVQGLVEFIQNNGHKKLEMATLPNLRYKTSLCRDMSTRGQCPKGANCTFAHSQEELEKYRARNKKNTRLFIPSTTSTLTGKEHAELNLVYKTTDRRLADRAASSSTVAEQLRVDTRNAADRTVNGDGHSLSPSSVVSLMSNMNLSPSSGGTPPGVKTVTKTTPGKPMPSLPNMNPMYPGSGPQQPQPLPGPPLNMPTPNGHMAPSDCYTTPRMSAMENMPRANMPYEMGMYQMRGGDGAPFPGSYHPHGHMGHMGQRYGMGMMPQGQCPNIPYQQGMDSNMMRMPYNPRAQYMPYNMCQVPAQLNPYAEPFRMTPPLCTHQDHEFRKMYSDGYGQPHVHHQQQHPAQGPMQNVMQLPNGHVQPQMVTGQGQAQVLDSLHQRRNKILARLNPNLQGVNDKLNGSENTDRNSSTSTGLMSQNRSMASLDMFSVNGDMLARPVTDLAKSVVDTMMTTRMTSSLDFHSNRFSDSLATGWDADMWPTIDTKVKSSPQDVMKRAPAATQVRDLEIDGRDIWNEGDIDNTEFMLNWLQGLPDEPIPLETRQETTITTTTRSMSVCSDRTDDEPYIPFDPPIVSKFGPISRTSRAKYKTTDPVQVIADEKSKKLTPVTAAAQRPHPTASRQPSILSTQGYHMAGYKPEPVIVTSVKSDCKMTTDTHSHHSSKSDPYAHRKGHASDFNPIRQELARLEQKANNASTENERLSCELQALELQIVAQTDPQSDMKHTNSFVYGEDFSNPESRRGAQWSSFELVTDNKTKNQRQKIFEAQQRVTESLHHKQQQEEQDRLLAERLVLEELCANRTDPTIVN